MTTEQQEPQEAIEFYVGKYSNILFNKESILYNKISYGTDFVGIITTVLMVINGTYKSTGDYNISKDELDAEGLIHLDTTTDNNLKIKYSYIDRMYVELQEDDYNKIKNVKAKYIFSDDIYTYSNTTIEKIIESNTLYEFNNQFINELYIINNCSDNKINEYVKETKSSWWKESNNMYDEKDPISICFVFTDRKSFSEAKLLIKNICFDYILKDGDDKDINEDNNEEIIS